MWWVLRHSTCLLRTARGLPLQDALDALHRAGYTEERMLHFLRVLGAAFDAYVQAALSKVSLWREPFKKVGKAVRECSHLLEAWEGCTARLTTIRPLGVSTRGCAAFWQRSS